jgi:pimeloyl-ACP methyl ester carboxylesterase
MSALLRSRSWAVFWLVCLLVNLLVPVAGAAPAPPPPAKPSRVYLHLPTNVVEGQKLSVLVLLHGMGGSGEELAADLTDDADRNGWVLVAPTIPYGDWTDPAQVAREDPQLIAWLARYLDNLGDETGLTLRHRVLFLGHSRGAQLAHRFALFHPNQTMAVAALSAGTYTLPSVRTAGKMLPFPYGVGDLSKYGQVAPSSAELSQVQFMVGVGSDDNNPAELPRQWDPYIGNNRVTRAQAFQRGLKEAGVESDLVLFPGAGHGLTPEMRDGACSFLETAEQNSEASDATVQAAAEAAAR